MSGQAELHWSTDAAVTADPHRPVAIWLLVCCALIFAMVVLGGFTRLTDSGLSIVEWAPLSGAIPPLSEAAWQQAFRSYQASPEYRLVNLDMSLEAFQFIFWVEYTHRLLGRMIGVVFLVPFLYFLVKDRIPRPMRPHLAAVFVLGALQGALGWYMVQSGLIDDPRVSPYRLAAHLALAFAIYAYILWLALGLLLPAAGSSGADVRPLRRHVWPLAALVFVTVVSGAFVAGLDAGLMYNTFPLMNGRIVPEDMFYLEPAVRNFFENPATAQFDHRVLAIATAAFVLGFWLLSRRSTLPRRARLSVDALLAAVVIQVGLGVSTLLLHVPVALGVAHQAGALTLFTVMLWMLYEIRSLRPGTLTQSAILEPGGVRR